MGVPRPGGGIARLGGVLLRPLPFGRSLPLVSTRSTSSFTLESYKRENNSNNNMQEKHGSKGFNFRVKAVRLAGGKPRGNVRSNSGHSAVFSMPIE